jgi:hypothetical protein
MSGFYDDASWVLIPEGIKEDVVYAQKPTNGTGDLTFTRASDATRTNSAGVIERTPWNLVTFSEQFNDASWTKSSAGTGIAPSVTANTSTSPIGTLTADRVQFNCTGTTFSDRSILFQTFTSAVVGRSYTFTIYIKANAPSEVGKQLRFNVDSGTNPAQVITITADWTRYTFAAIAQNTSINCLLETRGTVTTNTTADVLIWGAQLAEGTDAKPYFATTNRQDVPRLDYRNADGSVSTCPRLLLEPQRTNSIRNSTMVGAVAGSPGTLPTNWAALDTAGLTRTVVGLGTENGLQYIDLRFNGTATATFVRYGFDSSTQISASVGQSWTGSAFVKVLSTSPAPTGYVLRQREALAIGTLTADGETSFTPDGTLKRYTFNRTTTGATTERISFQIQFNVTLAATYDFTIRIAAPQMELGAYATTFIPTTTAAVTRLKDDASKTGVSSLIGQTEGTLFLEFAVPLNESVTRSIVLSSSTVANRVAISTFAGSVFARVDVGGVNQVNSNATMTVTNMNKVAFRYKENDFAVYVNGVKVITDTSGITFSAGTLDRFAFIQADSTSAFNGIVSQMAVFTTGLTDAQLAQITT